MSLALRVFCGSEKLSLIFTANHPIRLIRAQCLPTESTRATAPTAQQPEGAVRSSAALQDSVDAIWHQRPSGPNLCRSAARDSIPGVPFRARERTTACPAAVPARSSIRHQNACASAHCKLRQRSRRAACQPLVFRTCIFMYNRAARTKCPRPLPAGFGTPADGSASDRLRVTGPP